AIVTGAASGIGLALTKNLVARSWNVVMADISSSGYELAASIGSKQQVSFCETDVTSWKSQVELFRFAEQKYGSVNFVAANAGIDDRDDVYERFDGKEVPDPLNLKTYEVDLFGALYSYRLALHYFRKNNPTGGKLVFTSSSAGVYSFPSNPEYCSIKHALVGFTRSVAPLLKQENIAVNAVLPALVVTKL
ncbi:uncharacterized protein V1516DRAFT_605729, partial [Lipomyces oligophaga]|uniref:uncharacterized protein n=1 Tax=Lipomyces oligophaga TaxID=45792 RepID=UPI0034CF3216